MKRTRAEPGALSELLGQPPGGTRVRARIDGTLIELPSGEILELDSQRYTLSSARGRPGNTLADVEVVLDQRAYVMVSLPAPGPGRSRHLRFGHELSPRVREWVVQVLRLAVDRAHASAAPEVEPPEELRDMVGRLDD